MAGEIVHLEIPSRNFERSAAFYAKLFGWRTDGVQAGGHLLFEIPGSAGDDASGGNGLSGSWIRTALAQASGPLPFVAVEDIDKTLAEAQKQGGRILVPRLALAGKAQFGLLADLDGNVIAVIERPNGASRPPAKRAAEAAAPAKAAPAAPKAAPGKTAAPAKGGAKPKTGTPRKR
jgi:predicted enzyme related to lactoylglutathione lyase